MGQIVIGNKNNTYTYSYNAGAKTLAISGIVNFSVADLDLLSVYDINTASFFTIGGYTSFVVTYDSNGIPVYTWTFQSVPAGSANGDTLIIILGCPDIFMVYTILQQLLAGGGGGGGNLPTLIAGDYLTNDGTNLSWGYLPGLRNGSGLNIGFGTAAGTSPSGTLTLSGDILQFFFTMGTGTPTGSQIAILNFGLTLPYTPNPVFSAGNLPAAKLSGTSAIAMTSIDGTGVDIKSGTAFLVAGTVYVWNIIV